MWALATGAGLVVLLELGRVRGGRDYPWLLAEALVAVQHSSAGVLRSGSLLPLLALALGFHVALAWLHTRARSRRLRHHGVHEPGTVPARRRLPAVGVPTGAVTLFAVEAWLGDDSARTANALLMIPFQLAAVVAVWSAHALERGWQRSWRSGR